MKRADLTYVFRVITHPFDTFYEIRHRGRGSIPVAILMVFLFGLSFTLNRRYASFVVNPVNPRSVDSISEILGVMFAVVLFATANWSITCLMEGEGRFRDIFTVLSYSMLPMVLTFVPATVISWFIAADEESIYYLIKGVSVFLFVILLLIGIMTVHGFSFGKTLATLFLTIIALLLIIFLMSLLVYLLNQVFLFLQSVYTELVLRT